MDPQDDRIAAIVLRALGRISRGVDQGLVIRDVALEAYELDREESWDPDRTPPLGYHEQVALDAERRLRTPVRRVEVPTVPAPSKTPTLKSIPAPPPLPKGVKPRR